MTFCWINNSVNDKGCVNTMKSCIMIPAWWLLTACLMVKAVSSASSAAKGRGPTQVECADGSMVPFDAASNAARNVHCLPAVLAGTETPDHCPNLSFCPQELRALSPCGDCCHVCREPNEEFMAASKISKGLNASSTDPCEGFKCKKLQRCVKNIQGLPVCRCFPREMCSKPGLPLHGKRSKERRSKQVCASDAATYESRCHLQVEACEKNNGLRVLHKGPCMKPAASQGGAARSGSTENSSPSRNSSSVKGRSRQKNKDSDRRLTNGVADLPSRKGSSASVTEFKRKSGRHQGSNGGRRKTGSSKIEAKSRDNSRAEGRRGKKAEKAEKSRNIKIEKLLLKKRKLEKKLLREKKKEQEKKNRAVHRRA